MYQDENDAVDDGYVICPFCKEKLSFRYYDEKSYYGEECLRFECYYEFLSSEDLHKEHHYAANIYKDRAIEFLRLDQEDNIDNAIVFLRRINMNGFPKANFNLLRKNGSSKLEYIVEQSISYSSVIKILKNKEKYITLI